MWQQEVDPTGGSGNWKPMLRQYSQQLNFKYRVEFTGVLYLLVVNNTVHESWVYTVYCITCFTLIHRIWPKTCKIEKVFNFTSSENYSKKNVYADDPKFKFKFKCLLLFCHLISCQQNFGPLREDIRCASIACIPRPIRQQNLLFKKTWKHQCPFLLKTFYLNAFLFGYKLWARKRYKSASAPPLLVRRRRESGRL